MPPNKFPINFTQLQPVHTLCRKVCITGNFETLDKYFNKHPDTINTLDGYGNTPILLVIRYGQRSYTLEVINYLFDRGADPFIKNDQGYDALMCAIIYNVTSVIQWFFDHNFEFNLEDYSVLELVAYCSPNSLHLFLEHMTWEQTVKDTVLQILVCTNNDCSAILEHGANPNVVDLLSICTNELFHINQVQLRNFDTLLQYGAQVPDDIAFWTKISQYDISAISYIFNSLRQNGWTCPYFLFFYCYGMKYCPPSANRLIQFIEENSFDINLQDDDGNTCLHILVTEEHFHIAKTLVKRDALFLTNKEGYTPFYNLMKIRLHSCYYPKPNKKKLIELCLQKGAPVEEAYRAINTLEKSYRKESEQFINTLADKYSLFPMIKEPGFT